jgi:nicotinamidase/pyrazinamidase
MAKALVIVDVQNDFCPGGALAVPDGDQVVPVINQLSQAGDYDVIVATQDWHPTGHVSFAARHGVAPYTTVDISGSAVDVWPDHCVAGTEGADFHADLDQRNVKFVVRKGMKPDLEEYSAGEALRDLLHDAGVDTVDVAGLAFDFCVKNTALDLQQAGIQARIVENATRAVFPERAEELRTELQNQGVEVV